MLSEREKDILALIREKESCATGELYNAMNSSNPVSLATVKRDLKKLADNRLILPVGKGKTSRYILSPEYQILYPIHIQEYFSKEIDARSIKENFNWELLRTILPEIRILSTEEQAKLRNLQNIFRDHVAELGSCGYRKEMERLAIDLSWKSSQIEGNTYTLLETERLLKEKKTASGKTKEEAIMLLNHKEAMDFILENPDFLMPPTISAVEDIHNILIKELDVDRNIRSRRVGITGTNYRPLDNEFQIREAMRDMCDILKDRDVFEQAMLSLLLISYIQPFMDGNKRTSRIVSNAILIGNGYCPLSYRTVDSSDFKMAVLLFYEQNNLSAFKEIFIDQYEFAVKSYF